MKNFNAIIEHHGNIDDYKLLDNGVFPNSALPVLHYKQVLKIPIVFPGMAVKKLLHDNGWTNNWKAGIYTYHHYHSNTHEAMAVIAGKTMVLLGGENGTIITLKKGDVLVIPAGVAHKNLGKENAVTCIGGYPEGISYNMNYGKAGERPAADHEIARVGLPAKGPLCGNEDPLPGTWRMAGENALHGNIRHVAAV